MYAIHKCSKQPGTYIPKVAKLHVRLHVTPMQVANELGTHRWVVSRRMLAVRVAAIAGLRPQAQMAASRHFVQRSHPKGSCAWVLAVVRLDWRFIRCVTHFAQSLLGQSPAANGAAMA